MKRVLFILLIILCADSLPAQEKKLFWDGYDWRKLDSLAIENPEYVYWMKASYLAGLFDGKHFYSLRLFRANPTLYDSLFADLIVPLPFKELVPALDQFYMKELNCYLPIPFAYIAVRMSSLGYPQSEIDEYILQSKVWINRIILESMGNRGNSENR